MIEVTAAALAAHPMLHRMSTDHLAVLAGSASDVAFPAGHQLFEEGGSANHFWLLQSGSVALDLHVPGRGRVRIDTVGLGELLGWSWRFPPYRWAFGAVAAGPVEAFEFDAQAVRASCASEPELGHEVTERLARVLAKRLQSTRVRLIGASIHPVGIAINYTSGTTGLPKGVIYTHRGAYLNSFAQIIHSRHDETASTCGHCRCSTATAGAPRGR